MGVQVVPAFSVFQTPPDPTAAYQMLRFLGWMAISLIRPDIRAGPIFRNSSPDRTSAVRRLFFSAGLVSLQAMAKKMKMAIRAKTGILFILSSVIAAKLKSRKGYYINSCRIWKLTSCYRRQLYSCGQPFGNGEATSKV
jgi:hypothetical protein